jgi:hypothetical protein
MYFDRNGKLLSKKSIFAMCWKTPTFHMSVEQGTLTQREKKCFSKLFVKAEDPKKNPEMSESKIKSIHIREHLRQIEYKRWCDLPQKGRGVILYQEHTPANKWITQRKGLSSSEWRDAIKMTANVAPVRVLHGRSENGNRCRRCDSEIETLGHVLGFCKHGELLRNTRHHSIRTAIAKELQEKGWEVTEEVHCISTNGSTRRVDILAINPNDRKSYILDPTIRFETHKGQAEEVNIEKQNIYEPTIPYFKEKYNVNDIKVI